MTDFMNVNIIWNILILIIVVTINYIYIIINAKYNIKCNLLIFPGFSKEMKEVFKIPKQNLISQTFVNCDLPKPEVDYIKLFYIDENSYIGFKGFLPTLPGNPYFSGGYYPGLEKDLNYQYWNHNSTYVHLKNILTTYTSALMSLDLIYFHLDPNQPWARAHPEGEIIAAYENVIALGNTQLGAFSHYYFDLLAPLTLFPQDVIENSNIIIPFNTASPLEPIYAFGVKKEQLIILHPKEWIFSRNCYSTIPPPHIRHFGSMIKIVSDKLRSFYKLESIIPTNYFITNRKPGEFRYISNMLDVYQAIHDYYINEYNITFLDDPKDMKKMTQTWASAKLMFVVTGSTCIKSLFMKEKTVMIIALGNIMDNIQPLYAATHEVFTLTFPVKGLMHFRKWTNFTINISIAIRVFGVGAYCAKHGQWYQNESFRL